MTAPILLRVFHKVVGKEQDTTLFFVACHRKDVDLYSAPLESVILCSVMMGISAIFLTRCLGSIEHYTSEALFSCRFQFKAIFSRDLWLAALA